MPPADSEDIPDPLAHALTSLAHSGRLTEEQVDAALRVLIHGEASPVRAAALLMGMRVQGESGVEIAGAARALRSVMRTVLVPPGITPIDTAGTGGGHVGTFNVSTAAAFVAAGAGAHVAKHGNRSYTSRCGSADVLEALGIDLTVQADGATRILGDVGMVFLYAPAFHPAMRYVAPVRRELAVPTVMNLVGPLVNPASARRQVVGVADRERAPAVADALVRLGTAHALVVHGEAGMDEIAPHGPTAVWEVRNGEVTEWMLDPTALGIAPVDLDALRGGTPKQNAERILRLFTSPANDPAGRAATVLNAGAALYVAGVAASVGEGVG
ncbi:MAG: anthranilate phosphoribosyltransferase, partial [Gemmatimonadota bacterium]|nr:anthranilate phosphoribosyltransferase [Gemmatimonadota bacterium]